MSAMTVLQTRVPLALHERIEALRPTVNQLYGPALSRGGASRSDVVRVALTLGLEELERRGAGLTHDGSAEEL